MTPMLLRLIGVALVAIYAVDAQNPVVTITEPRLPEGINTFTAEAGTMVDIVCVVRNLPHDKSVTWQKVNGGDTQFISKDVHPMDDQFSVIKPNSISWKLRIKNVQRSMNGLYQCFVSNDAFSETMDVIYLEVINRPRINNILTSADKMVTEGEPMTLRCNAEGIPEPVIKWMRLALADLPAGGKELRRNDLYVEKIRAEHRGKYICQADNLAGRARRVITVSVKFRPIVTPQNTVVYQALGYAALLMCDIEAFPQPTAEQISWSRSGVAEYLDSNFIQRTTLGANDRVTTRLYIKQVRKEDYGSYECIASNNLGNRKTTMELREISKRQPEPAIIIYDSSSTHITSSIFINLLLFVTFLLCRT